MEFPRGARFTPPKRPDRASAPGVQAEEGQQRYTSRTTPHVTYVTRQVGPRARILYAVQGRISDTLFSGKTTQAAWRSKPSWYAISTEDRTISPELERFMADRMKAKTIEVKASHLSLISQPHEITHLIVNAAGHRG